MQLKGTPLPSPLPTTAPQPRDVIRKLLAPRQVGPQTCGWVSGDLANPINCATSGICVHNTKYGAVWCCYTSLESCGLPPTTCLDSTDAAARCTGGCLYNSAVAKCTDATAPYCVDQVYNLATVPTLLTGFACSDSREIVTVFDHYTLDGGGLTTVTAIQTEVIAPSTSSGVDTVTSPTVTATPVNTPNTHSSNAAATTIVAPVVSSGLSGGQIAGVVVGALAGIAIISGLIFLLYFQRRRHKRQQNSQDRNPQAMIQAPMSPSPNPQSPMTNPHSSFMSMPSTTSSSAPLTHQNMAVMPQQIPEVTPNDSASNIGGHQNSILSQATPPTYHSNTGSNSASQEHSGLGSLPSSPYATGAAAFPHYNTASVISPGSAFGSMPPVHAPSVTSYRPPGE